MRLQTWVAGALLLALQGCAGTPSAFDPGDSAALRSLPLFDAAGDARFAVELGCSGAPASCTTVEHAFSDWADSRHLLRDGAPDEPSGGHPLPDRRRALPYRLALTVVPVIVPSVDITHVDQSGGLTGSGYTPPRVGYHATIRVFNAATGALLKELPAAEQRTADFHADANGYLRAEMKALITSLDPAYRR